MPPTGGPMHQHHEQPMGHGGHGMPPMMQQHSGMSLQSSPNSHMHLTGPPPPPPGHNMYGPPPTADDYMNQSCAEPSSSNGQGVGGNQAKKRKTSDSPPKQQPAMSMSALVHIKREPVSEDQPTTTSMIPCEEDFGFDYGQDGSVYLDSTYQCIRFQTFQQTNWHTLLDANLKEL